MITDHTVRAYDTELIELRQRIAEMGGLAEKMLSDAMQSLLKRDTTLAQTAIIADRRLDLLQREVEDKAVLTIAKRQPMASDLREIISAMRLASDIERIGDLAKNIAKRVVAMNGEYPPLKVVFGAVNLSTLVLAQLKDVLDAYSRRDLELATQVWKRDDEVDALYTSLFRELLTYMMEDPRNITFCTHLLFCAKNIERIGDHATNIAETAHYLITGELLPVERPKADTTTLSPNQVAVET
ncbi:phosphate-specific transport system accessory protein PhoU [Blastochloris tepida]|uniref:Phosphate-specific transport system accessory protein PhoU n=1 Tax=Blastochloris tepida TaxID=2233851 RepID=A0A348G3Y1_9HYPH|nr:phosphate-specific transport system accessory protein PhoU [Blastochloris tepida]